MGYTTEFEGKFELNQPLTEELAAYLHKFSRTRRMKRNVEALKEVDAEVKDGFAGSFGKEGEYYIGGKGFAGQAKDDSIIDYNNPPNKQPGLWCQWIPTDDLTGIVWDGAEKFYDPTEWIEYIIQHFLEPNGYILNGVINAQGEEMGDIWHIKIHDNVVSTGDGLYSQEENRTLDQWENLAHYVDRLINQYEKYGDEDAIVALEEVRDKMNELEGK